MDVSFKNDQIDHEIEIVSRKEPRPKTDEKKDKPKGKKDEVFDDEVIADSDRVIKMTVAWKKKDELDITRLPFLDFPVAAIRSPAIRVQANNLIQISVLVKRPIRSNPGIGGVIIRDSIGGEQFQYRNGDDIPGYSRVVLYRKAPADGNFYVTLGLAGYDEVYFDDFRVQVIEEDSRSQAADPNLVQQPRRRSPAPALPSPRIPAESATLPSETRRQQR